MLCNECVILFFGLWHAVDCIFRGVALEPALCVAPPAFKHIFVCTAQGKGFAAVWAEAALHGAIQPFRAHGLNGKCAVRPPGAVFASEQPEVRIRKGSLPGTVVTVYCGAASARGEGKLLDALKVFKL